MAPHQYPYPDPDPDPKILRDDVGDDAPRQTRKIVNGATRRKAKPENQEAQRLIHLFRGAVHEKRGLTPSATMGKDTARVAAKMVKARPAIENEAITLAFATEPPKINGAEVTQNVGAWLGFAEAAASTPTYREMLKFLQTAEGRATVDQLVERGRSLKGVSA